MRKKADCLPVPETVQQYHASADHRRTIDLVLEHEGMAPADLDWDELRQYFHTWLRAEQTRLDAWDLLLAANRHLWGHSLPTFGGRLRECDPLYYDRDNSVRSAWDEQALYRFLVPEDGSSTRIQEALLGCWVDGGYLRLWLWFMDADQSCPSSYLDLGRGWDPDPHNDERYTAYALNTEAVHLSSPALDVSDLQQAADDAMARLAAIV